MPPKQVRPNNLPASTSNIREIGIRGCFVVVVKRPSIRK